MFKPLMRCLLVFVSLWLSLLIGCGEDDDNDWIGTWTLETVDGKSLEQLFTEDLNLKEEAGIEFHIDINYEWTFYSDEMMDVEMTVEIEAKDDVSSFSEEGSMRVTGTYAISGSNFTITFLEIEEVTGDLKESGLEEESLDPSDVVTGTWSRNGNTLTLNSDDGGVIVLKRK